MMNYFFYGILLILFLTMVVGDKKIRKDEYCKEGLFYQMFFNKCTPRKFLYNEEIQEKI